MTQYFFITGDWGTSHLRLFLCESQVGGLPRIIDQRTGLGVAACQGNLAGHLLPLIKKWVEEYGKIPILMSGMVGANIGWVETPYLICPVDSKDIIKGRTHFVAEGHKIAISSGLSCVNSLGFADIMRGEEHQVLGWLMMDEAHRQGEYLICVPGTHTKWVWVQDGQIINFTTSMTGELFALLSKHSILVMGEQASPLKEVAFDHGVEKILEIGPENLLSGLFGVRSRQIRENFPKVDGAAFLSGHLIGADVISAVKLFKPLVNKVVLIGEPLICQLFDRALNKMDIQSQMTNAADVFLSGFNHTEVMGNIKCKSDLKNI